MGYANIPRISNVLDKMLEMGEKKIPGTGLCPNVVTIGDMDEFRDDFYHYLVQIISVNSRKFRSIGVQ